MKVNELPKETNLVNVKVRLPDDVLAAFEEYAGGEPEMFLAGRTMGEMFMTPDPYGETRRLYPFPPYMDPLAILEWEVVENNNK